MAALLVLGAPSVPVAQELCIPRDAWGGEVPCTGQDALACYAYALDRIPDNIGQFLASRMIGRGDRIIGTLTDASDAQGSVELSGHTLYDEPVTVRVRRGAVPTPEQHDCTLILDADGSQPGCVLARGGSQPLYFTVDGGGKGAARFYLYGTL